MTGKLIYYRDTPGLDVFAEVVAGKEPVSMEPPKSAATYLADRLFDETRRADLERAERIAELKEAVEFWKAEAAALLKQLEEERISKWSRM